jgi:uncharacterized protein YkwD
MTFRPIVLCAVLAAGLAITPPVSTAAGQRMQRDAALERALLSEMNEVRSRHGLRPLAMSSELRSAAVSHTRSMAETGLFQHDSADGSPFHERVLRYYDTRGHAWSVGENLAYGSAPLGATAAVNGWLRSPAHRRNLLNPAWREVGVGAIVAKQAPGAFHGDTVAIVTADFGRRN